MKYVIKPFYLVPLIILLTISLILLIPQELSAQAGTIDTYAGTGAYGYAGDGGPALGAKFRTIDHLALDADGNLYISEYYGHRVRKIDKTTGIITTVAGNGSRGFGGLGGLATSAQLYEPYGVAFDASGNMYIGEYGGSRLLKVDASTGIMTNIGFGPRGHSGDGGPVMYARFNVITDIMFDPAGNLYIAEAWQEKIRKITAVDGVIDRTDHIETIAGVGSPAGYSGNGGLATAAKLWHPSGLAMNAAGDLFISSVYNDCIRKIDAITGIITTIAGRGYSLGDGGLATNAQLDFVTQIDFDQAGNLFVADYRHHRVRMIDTNGIITTVAGTGTQGHSGDGAIGTSAQISNPAGLVVDQEGNIFFSESNPYHYVRIIHALCSEPIPSFSATNECNGNTTMFVDLSTNLSSDASYEWDIDNDGTADYTTAGNITHTYPSSGSYTARLTISQGNCSATTTRIVSVYDNPTVDAGANQTVNYGYPNFNSATAYLNATSNGGTAPYTYEWSPAIGLDDPTSANPIATLGNTDQTYMVTITDAWGCTASDQIKICVNDLVCKVMNKNYKVSVCHTDNNGNLVTLCVAESAVASHLAHGDILGSCQSINQDCIDTEITRKAQSVYTPWEMKVYPNPFQLQARIEFYVPENGNVTVDVFNMNGQKVRDVFSATVEENQMIETIFDGSGLPNGLYLIRLSTKNQISYEKIMLAK